MWWESSDGHINRGGSIAGGEGRRIRAWMYSGLRVLVLHKLVGPAICDISAIDAYAVERCGRLEWAEAQTQERLGEGKSIRIRL